MLVFDAGAVMRAIVSIRQLETSVRSVQASAEDMSQPVDDRGAKVIIEHLDEVSEAVSGLSAKITSLAISEMRGFLTNPNGVGVSYRDVPDLIQELGKTLRRELSLLKTFCVEPSKESFFLVDLATFGSNFQTGFPSAVFEIDEAGKCHALGRSTAAVFHLMRSMEIGINAVANSLGIPAPVKDAERNWGKILEKIKAEIERRNKALPATWKSNDKSFFSEVYVSLDAVRVAWRNTTMHVENKYTDDEAEHIFVAVRGFMKRLCGRMDEMGQPLA
jgi:hypothetical protein